MANHEEILEPCPNCLGTGEAYTGKFMKPCKVCNETGTVTIDIRNHYINEL